MNIIVVFGGKSCEHDVSIVTGVMVCNCLNKENYNVIPVYISKDNAFYTHKSLFNIENYKNIATPPPSRRPSKRGIQKLKKIVFIAGENILYYKNGKKLKPVTKIDYAINCCHGGIGENGSLYGFLDACNIPVSSSRAFGASVAMDKCFTKILCKALNIKMLKHIEISDREYGANEAGIIEHAVSSLKLPIMVKPANLGSSIGITKAVDLESLKSGLKTAFEYDTKVLLEHALTGFTELFCAAYKLNNEIIVSECEKAVLKNDMLTFGDKYDAGIKSRPDRIFPYLDNKDITDQIKNITKTVYSELDLNGIVRIDFLVKNKEVYLNEINTIPGSLAYYLFCKNFGEFSGLLDKLISCDVEEYNNKSKLQYSFQSEVLEIKSGK